MTTFDVAFFHAERIQRSLTLGTPLSALAETGSTNDDALVAARGGARHGATFVADFQHEGRGRDGNRWLAPPAENLTFSVLLRPDLQAARAPMLTLAVGLAVRDAAARLLPGESVGIKWPNDIWVGERKLAGVLLESVIQGGKLAAVVAGVGLNIKTRTFPSELSARAVSLALLGREVQREIVLLDILEAVAERTKQVARAGLSPLLVDLREHDALKGRQVRIDAEHGTAAGFSVGGELILETDTGPKLIRAGHVELMP